MLEQDTTKKGQVNDMQLDFKFEIGDDKKYDVVDIWDSTAYTRKSVGQLPRFYYLVLWKSFSEKDNSWEPAMAIQPLQRLVTAYYKDKSKKPIATSALIDTAPPIARPIVKPTMALTKKRG